MDNYLLYILGWNIGSAICQITSSPSPWVNIIGTIAITCVALYKGSKND